MAFAWVSLVLLSVTSGPAEPTVSPDVQRQYQEQRAQAGRTPDDQVRLALWCEAHGLSAERLKHLAHAVLSDPSHGPARGLLGLVSYQGKWQPPDTIAAKVQDDADEARRLAEYDARRSVAEPSADSQWRLGLWCEREGLADQARAHFTAVTRLDPSHEAAWRRLGHVRHDGRWMTPAQVDADRVEAAAQKKADRHWKLVLDHWKPLLNSPARRDEADAALLAVSDPRAIPTVVRTFATGRSEDQRIAVRMLGNIEGVASSRVLAVLAVSSRDSEVRRSAVETLRQRDPREFVRLWIGRLRAPVSYQVKRAEGPEAPGEVVIAGTEANLRRIYNPTPVPDLVGALGARATTDEKGDRAFEISNGRYQSDIYIVFPNNPATGLAPRGLTASGNANLSPEARAVLNRVAQAAATTPGVPEIYFTSPEGILPLWRANPEFQATVSARLGGLFNQPLDLSRPVLSLQVDRKTLVSAEQLEDQAWAAARAAQEQMERDVATLNRGNSQIRSDNGPVLLALGTVTGVNLGNDPVAWSRWTTDQEGYAFVAADTQRPTVVEQVSSSYLPTISGQTYDTIVIPRPHNSCFAAGTLVRTIAGSRPIETINVGDRVLVQDTTTGELGYQPVVATFHNPPAGTLRVTLGGETVVATGIHRFWKAGHGWAMARDLRPGDVVRTLGGTATVSAVEDGKVQPVFNLEVAAGRSYFVSSGGVLVHDNSLVEPTPDPFDAPRPVARTAD